MAAFAGQMWGGNTITSDCDTSGGIGFDSEINKKFCEEHLPDEPYIYKARGIPIKYGKKEEEKLPKYIDGMEVAMRGVSEEHGDMKRFFEKHQDKYVRDIGRDRWVRKDLKDEENRLAWTDFVVNKLMKVRKTYDVPRLHFYKHLEAKEEFTSQHLIHDYVGEPSEFKKIHSHAFHDLLEEFKKLCE